MGAPALIDAQGPQVLSALNAWLDWSLNHVVGAAVSDGGTSQATGASGALNFDADVSALAEAVVDGVGHYEGLGAATDVDSDAGSGVDFGATSGKSVVFAVVFETGSANDTPAYFAQAGAVADTGAQIAPTDAEVTAGLGHSNWVRIANMTVNRTGDTTVTVSVDDDVRNSLKGRSLLAATEEAFQAA